MFAVTSAEPIAPVSLADAAGAALPVRSQAWWPADDPARPGTTLGSFVLTTPATAARLEYAWPFDGAANAGRIWALARTDKAPALPDGIGAAALLPDDFQTYRAAAAENAISTQTAPFTVDGVALADGDRVLVLVNDRPVYALQWSPVLGAQRMALRLGATSGTVLLAVRPGGTWDGGRAWLLDPEVDVAASIAEYRVVLYTSHPLPVLGPTAEAVDRRTVHLFCALVADSAASATTEAAAAARGPPPSLPPAVHRRAIAGNELAVLPRYALLSKELTVDGGGAWARLSEYETIGSLPLMEPAVVTGLVYRWPYPADQAGTVWVLVPDPPRLPPSAVVPRHLFFVRAVYLSGPNVPTGTADGVSLANQDRVLELTGASGTPLRTLLWSTARARLEEDVADLAPIAAEGLLIVVLAGGTTFGHRGFWHPPGGTAWYPYRVAIEMLHPRTGLNAAVRLSDAAVASADQAAVRGKR